MNPIEFKLKAEKLAKEMIKKGIWNLRVARQTEAALVESYEDSPEDAIIDLKFWETYLENPKNWPQNILLEAA